MVHPKALWKLIPKALHKVMKSFLMNADIHDFEYYLACDISKCHAASIPSAPSDVPQGERAIFFDQEVCYYTIHKKIILKFQNSIS